VRTLIIIGALAAATAAQAGSVIITELPHYPPRSDMAAWNLYDKRSSVTGAVNCQQLARESTDHGGRAVVADATLRLQTEDAEAMMYRFDRFDAVITI
jgi:hypothetical protein